MPVSDVRCGHLRRGEAFKFESAVELKSRLRELRRRGPRGGLETRDYLLVLEELQNGLSQHFALLLAPVPPLDMLQSLFVAYLLLVPRALEDRAVAFLDAPVSLQACVKGGFAFVRILPAVVRILGRVDVEGGLVEAAIENARVHPQCLGYLVSHLVDIEALESLIDELLDVKKPSHF